MLKSMLSDTGPIARDNPVKKQLGLHETLVHSWIEACTSLCYTEYPMMISIVMLNDCLEEVTKNFILECVYKLIIFDFESDF